MAMLQYDKERLNNLYLQDAAKYWLRNEMIDKSTFEQIITTNQPAYKRSGFWYKSGMMLLTFFVGSSAFSFISLFVGYSSLTIDVLMLLSLVLLFFLFKRIVTEKHYFQNGIDYGMQYLASFNAAYLLFSLVNPDKELTVAIYFVLLTAFNVLMFIAYLHFVWAVLSFVTLSISTCSLILAFASNAVLYLPFVLMTLSMLVYFFAQRFFEIKNLFWHFGLSCLQAGCLVVFYFACNYYVIDQICFEYYQGHPVGWIQYVFTSLTIMVPFVYVFKGLKKRCHFKLIIGLMAMLASAFVIRTYYGIMPLAYALICAGLVLLVCVWLARKFLTETKGFSFTKGPNHKLLMQWMGVVMSQVTVTANQTDVNTQPTDGGKFGGGGAGNSY